MLSLSPRYDLFRFNLPKDFLPKEIQAKYAKLLSKNAGVVTTPIDYLNESIQGVNLPGISGLTVEQTQHEANKGIRRHNTGESGLGRINVEPQHQITYKGPGNPLEKINKEFKVTFRMNQGLYNYYMLYETILYRIAKHIDYPSDEVLYIEIMNEAGTITNRIKLNDCHLDGIEGLDFTYNKTSRDVGTFDVTFKFNNIDFDFLPQ
jgi:hypothetical protein